MHDEPLNGQSATDLEKEATDTQEIPSPSRKADNATVNESDDDDDDGRIWAILQDIRTHTLHPSLSEERAPLQARIKKGAKLAVQQMEYVRLMEDRMKSMEKRLLLIENKGVEPEPPAPHSKTAQPVDFIVDIRRMTFKEYLPEDSNPGVVSTDPLASYQHRRRHDFPGQLPYHLIDVVFGGENQTERLDKSQTTKLAVDALDPAPPSLTTHNQDLMRKDPPSIQPERIRINSTLLLLALQKKIGIGFAVARVVESDNHYELRDQVILRPFKLFVTFEQEIRDEIDRLQNMDLPKGNNSNPEALGTATSNGHNSEGPSMADIAILPDTAKTPSREQSDGHKGDRSQNVMIDASISTESEEINFVESRLCLEELLVLKDLLDIDLRPTFDLRRQIKDGSLRSIAFQDLWHLFPLGSEIVSNDVSGQSQAFRILNVSGGRPFLCTRFDADMDLIDPVANGKDVPKFEILSYYYGFDGKELGTCQKLHTIKSYDGNKAITSLPCFPIIYSKHTRGIKARDFFIERGKRFVELTRKTEVVHKRYNGLTLAMDELREEVRQART